MPFVREAPRVIAVGFDGTPGARAALEEASELAGRSGAAMRVISVSAPRPPTLGPAATTSTAPASLDASGDLQQVLHDAIAELPRELRALPVHERGDPSTELLGQTGEGVDLLVLGSHGFGPVLRLMLGSVAARVIRKAQCPVLVVPQGVRGTGR
jgi:nucleotide-binding universal stress UspA family protein